MNTSSKRQQTQRGTWRQLCLLTASLLFSQSVISAVIFVGEQDGPGGIRVPDVDFYNSFQFNEDPDLHEFAGADFGSNFSKSWHFDFANSGYSSAILSVGLYDYDCFLACDILEEFLLDGISFKPALRQQIQTRGQRINGAYDVFSVDLTTLLPHLRDGNLSVTLGLKAPSGGRAPNNGAGLDFASLDIEVPTPGVLILFLSSLSLLWFSRRSKAL